LKSGQDYRGKNYASPEYQTSRWGQNKEVTKKSYQNAGRSSHEGQSPWYIEKTANAAGVQSRWDGSRYKTNQVAKNSAQKPREDVYTTSGSYSTSRKPELIPRIRGYQDNYVMSVDQMKEILDR